MDATTRLARLRMLIEQRGGPVALAKELGYSNASYIVQMAGPNPMRPVTEKTARRFEVKLNMEPGWFDQPVAVDDIPAVVRLVGHVLDAEKVSVPVSRFADIVALALEHTSEGRGEYIKRLAKLLA